MDEKLINKQMMVVIKAIIDEKNEEELAKFLDYLMMRSFDAGFEMAKFKLLENIQEKKNKELRKIALSSL